MNIEHSAISKRYEFQWALFWGLAYLFFLPAIFYLMIVSLLPSLSHPSVWAQLGAGGVAIIGWMIQSPRLRYALTNQWMKIDYITILLAIAALLLSALGWDFVVRLFIPAGIVNSNQQALIDLARSAPVLTGLLTLAVAPMVEELLFRGVVFGYLIKHTPWLAWILSTLGFAFIHAIASFGTPDGWQELITLPAYVLAAIILTLAYQRKQRLGDVIVIHIIYNAIVYTLMLIGG